MKVERPTTVLLVLSILLVMCPVVGVMCSPYSIGIVVMFVSLLLLFVFSLLHGMWAIRRGIAVFLLVVVVVTFTSEWLGVSFGVPFGHYYYTEKLGPKILDIPWVIPIQWFNMMYVCYFMACIVCSPVSMRQSPCKAHVDLLGVVARAFLTGLFMVGWDLINDPFMANGVGAWVWTNPTEYFGLMYEGIPLSNFIGWVLVSVLTVLIFETLAHRMDIKPGWISGTPRTIANILVLVPFVFDFAIQILDAIGLGLTKLQQPVGFIPPILGTIVMTAAAVITLLGYRRAIMAYRSAETLGPQPQVGLSH